MVLEKGRSDDIHKTATSHVFKADNYEFKLSDADVSLFQNKHFYDVTIKMLLRKPQ